MVVVVELVAGCGCGCGCSPGAPGKGKGGTPTCMGPMGMGKPPNSLSKGFSAKKNDYLI